MCYIKRMITSTSQESAASKIHKVVSPPGLSWHSEACLMIEKA